MMGGSMSMSMSMHYTEAPSSPPPTASQTPTASQAPTASLVPTASQQPSAAPVTSPTAAPVVTTSAPVSTPAPTGTPRVRPRTGGSAVFNGEEPDNKDAQVSGASVANGLMIGSVTVALVSLFIM